MTYSVLIFGFPPPAPYLLGFSQKFSIFGFSSKKPCNTLVLKYSVLFFGFQSLTPYFLHLKIFQIFINLCCEIFSIDFPPMHPTLYLKLYLNLRYMRYIVFVPHFGVHIFYICIDFPPCTLNCATFLPHLWYTRYIVLFVPHFVVHIFYTCIEFPVTP